MAYHDYDIDATRQYGDRLFGHNSPSLQTDKYLVVLC